MQPSSNKVSRGWKFSQSGFDGLGVQLYEDFYYNTEMPEKRQKKSIMNNLELNRNFGISHGKFHYCKSNNLLEEEKSGLIGLQMEEDDQLGK